MIVRECAGMCVRAMPQSARIVCLTERRECFLWAWWASYCGVAQAGKTQRRVCVCYERDCARREWRRVSPFYFSFFFFSLLMIGVVIDEEIGRKRKGARVSLPRQ